VLAIYYWWTVKLSLQKEGVRNDSE
jgi:hypothetical protein